MTTGCSDTFPSVMKSARRRSSTAPCVRNFPRILSRHRSPDMAATGRRRVTFFREGGDGRLTPASALDPGRALRVSGATRAFPPQLPLTGPRSEGRNCAAFMKTTPALKAKYKRILLKLSGEALAGETGIGIDPTALRGMAEQIKEVRDLGVEV